MTQVYNFNAGPAMLPIPVMQQVKEELLDWNGLGMSVMEISHRSKPFMKFGKQSEQDLRDLLNIPDNYKILFLPAGGRGQFSMVPMNLINGYKTAAYVHTGIWGTHASEEAERYCDVNVIASSESTRYTTIPPQAQWQSFSDAAYVHYVDNETVNGVEFSFTPNTGDVALVSDMSSNLLTRPLDVSKYGLIYACAQKNIGPAGVTIVIIRDDLLKREPLPTTPCMYRYHLHAENDSLYNTPPTFPWYVSGLVLQWVKREGGVAEMDRRSKLRSQALYHYIDKSSFYHNPVEQSARSRMNVIFNLADSKLEDDFLHQAEAAGLMGLKGHRYLGGMRASIYNAMPQSGVDTLISFMQEFERRHG